ncbi:MAG: hypothetical protein EWM47_01480 [Anaerolineaceae bacterium]|nr:MAG: hypothetical protein EWM47_01480 [Anaerolineaceae bacterium]
MSRNLNKIIYIVIVLVGTLFLSACGNKSDTSLEDVGGIIDIINEDTETDIEKQSDNDDQPDNIDQHINNEVPAIAFVQQDYFYSDTVHIEIERDKPCDIYYTMDGSDPDKTASLYRDNIELRSVSQTNVYSIKAKGYYEDGSETDTIVHTYFVGKDVHRRFNTLIFSITSDPYNLYDYEYGILIPGKLRDDFVKNNPHKNIDPPDPANFNIRGRESEREVYLEIFEPDGTVVASQNAGIRVYGGWSRANNQKSLKIFARRSYDEVNNKIRYEFFPDKKVASGDGTIISAFKRLVLRNTGNDNGFAFIRDELFHTLAGQAGFRDYQAVRPLALFINGEYRGHLWLHEVYCDEYFEQHYGEYTGNFEILEGGETYKKADEDGDNDYAIKDYENAYSYAYRDLTDDFVYNQLRKVIDVENYLEYYALQIHIGNEDWPHNNYKTYRYFAAEGEEYGEAPFDGKWRYLLHDLDFSSGIYGTGPWIDNIRKYITTSGKISRESPLFSKLIQRDDCKEYFVKRTLDLINGAFSSDNLSKVLYQMHASRLNEQNRMYDKNLIADWVRKDQLPGRVEDLKYYAAERVNYTLEKYQAVFKLGEIYELNVKPVRGAGVRINNIEVFSNFSGSYYPDYDTLITAIVPAGEEFSHWIVNGEIVNDFELAINSSYINDGKVEVACEFKKKAENPKIIISEVCSDGDNDYIILHNPYKDDVSLLGYSITDDRDEPGKLILPMRQLRSGESLTILGESNQEIPTSKMIRAGFNLKDGETVALYLNGELIDEVTIPDLTKGNVYTRDLKTMRFTEERRLKEDKK